MINKKGSAWIWILIILIIIVVGFGLYIWLSGGDGGSILGGGSSIPQPPALPE
tara:strand:+ start:166 stop:324 length:159 start_codon:yes stop_codon:yes gene_type:complete